MFTCRCAWAAWARSSPCQHMPSKLRFHVDFMGAVDYSIYIYIYILYLYYAYNYNLCRIARCILSVFFLAFRNLVVAGSSMVEQF